MGPLSSAELEQFTFVTHRLGLVPYQQAWELQKCYHAEIAQGMRPPTLLLLEHPRTITLGRSTKPSSLLFPEHTYQELGFEVFSVERGGDATYHGPGQLIAYPLFPLRHYVGDFLRNLEQVLLNVVASYGIVARPSPGYAGLWAKYPDGTEAKIASIGIAVSRKVAYHGFALNVSTDLTDFDKIVPCGLQNARVTSMKELLGTTPTMDKLCNQIVEAVNLIFSPLPPQ